MRVWTPLEIAYNENLGAVRDVTFTITTTGGTGTDTEDLTLRQLVAPPALSFTTEPADLTAIPVTGITFTIDVAPGGSATGWGGGGCRGSSQWQ